MERLSASGPLMRSVAKSGKLIAGDFHKIEIDAAKHCEAPIEHWTIARIAKGKHNERPSNIADTGLSRSVWVACRRCPGCRAFIRRMWIARCLREYSNAKRTWFCTLTFKPDTTLEMDEKAVKRCFSSGQLVDTPEGHYTFLASEANKYLTDYLKRLRGRKSKGLFRYFAVVEPTKRFIPHFHLLLFEQAETLTKAYLQEKWAQNGFSVVKLVDDKRAIVYCTKYIQKEAQARVRASLGFGGNAHGVESDEGSVKGMPTKKNTETNDGQRSVVS